jgi:hypothetical protein
MSLLRHVRGVIVHKGFVLRAGLRTKAPLRLLLIHDWTKLSPAEAPGYARQFFGDKGDPAGFEKAWDHHKAHNPHHWEFWVDDSGVARSVPEHFVREMVADWLGASRSYEGKWPALRSDWPWLAKNLPRINLHPDTRVLVERVLKEVLPL